jgi:fatty acid desaturase
LASERDEELWPFVIPGTPRGMRVAAAVLELTMGLIYTPFLFLRAFFRKGSPIRDPQLRKAIWVETVLIALQWAVLIGVAAWWGAWKYFFVLYLLPGWIAGNLQSWRKYIEHVGLTGSTVLGSTRSIVPRTRLGQVMARTLFNEPYHGVHHRYARLPQAALPEFAAILSHDDGSEQRPFGSYWQALPPMLRSLRDPRVGAQWLWQPTASVPEERGRPNCRS